MKKKVCFKKVTSLLLCMAIVFSVTSVYGEVVRQPGEAWNTYLGRVYNERYDELMALREKNSGNTVPDDEVWKGDAIEPTEDADGDGLLDIYTAAQFRWALTYKKSMELMNDIDLGGRNNVSWTPVADPGNITIEGNGYTVYNMNVSGSAKVGMISVVGRANTGFEMRNIRFRYCYTQSSGQYSGTVVGWMLAGKMTQVSVEDSVVHGAAHTGGIVSGWNGDGDSALKQFFVTMDQCHVRNITVYGTSCVGSFVGPVSGYKITNSYGIDSYDISTATHSGGFVSCPGNCWVENCFTNVKLYCNSDGGVFAGICHLSNMFKNCFSAGVVEGTSNVGGFFGRSENSIDTFVNCYSTSMVGMQNKASNMGGFYGYDSNNTVRGNHCYSAGEVGTTQTATDAATIGGFGGDNSAAGRFTDCYYDKQTSGMGEYAISNTLHTNYAGITGYLTGQMIGDAMEDKLGTDDWVYQDGMYPQLSVFVNADESFGNETDRAIARAYSAASVCTALLQPSNLNKTQEELENYGTSDYDTVRDISVLFPMTNNDLAGYGSGSGLSISWDVREGYTCQLPGTMNGLPVITVDPKTYEVTNFSPGIGWMDVSVDTGKVNPQNGENIVGQRFMRLVPTTVISLASSAGVDRVIYVAKDNRLDREDAVYDHRDSVVFAAGRAQDVDDGKIKSSTYPEDDETFGYAVTVGDNGETKIEVVGVDLTGEAGGGKVVVVVSKLNEETGEYDPLDIATNDDLKALLLNKREAEPEDIGVYCMEYRWYTTGNLKGGYITNSKTVTVRNVLQLTYDWNHPDHAEDSLLYKDDYPYTIGASAGDVDHSVPADPATKGYTFKGWSTDPKAKPESFVPFTAQTPLQDDTKVYAVWQINEYTASVVKNGRGTVTGTGKYKYGDTAVLTWEPEENWYVNTVIVDGVIRDDLLEAGEYAFEKIEENHTIYVEFGTEQQVTEEPYYRITTARKGGSSDCRISNSVSAQAGDDITVTWTAGEGYKVTKVLIDGVIVDALPEGSYTFKGIGRDHNIEVVFDKKEETGSIHVADGYAVVTTSKTGSGTVSPGAGVSVRDPYTVTWDPAPGYKTVKLVIDGVEYTEESILDAGQYTISPVEHDRKVEVVFEPDPDSPDQPEPTDPDAVVKTYTVETMISGGPGTITPGAMIEVVTSGSEPTQEQDYKIEWNVDDPRYKVKDVIVDGASVKESGEPVSEIEFKEVNKDHTVMVILEPNLYQVQTMVEGKGSVTPGATVIWGDNYTVRYAPAEGWVLKQIYVDDEPQIQEQSFYAMRAADDAGPIDFNGIDRDHTVKIVYVETDADPGEEEIKHTVTTSLSGGIGTITPGAVLKDASGYDVTWEAGEGYEVDGVVVKVNGVTKEGMVSGNQVHLENLSDDVEVFVTLRPSKKVNIPGEEPGDDPEPSVYNIYTGIEKGAGTITSSLLGVTQGSDQTVYWTFGSDAAIRTIYIDGVVRDDLLLLGQYTFSDIDRDHTVEIFMKENPGEEEPDKESYHITTSMSGQGDISDSTAVGKDDTATVTWKPAEGYKVSKVIIDGAEKEDLLTSESITFAHVGANHSVYVEFSKKDSAGGEITPPEDEPSRYTVTTTMQGNGTISSSAVVEEGQSKSVRWSPKSGSKVVAVIIDGVIRDDLLKAEQVVFNDVDQDHSVEVLFKENETGEDQPGTEEPGGKEDPEYVHIKTAISGQGTISGSKTMKAGDHYTVSWKAAEGWKVKEVLIDGIRAHSLKEAQEINFSEIRADHAVSVIFVPEDGSVADTSYKIETEIIGGGGSITASGEVPEGGSYTVAWKAGAGYEVAGVFIDGRERTDLLKAESVTLDSVDGEHKVRVILREIKQESPGESQDSDVGSTDINTGDDTSVATWMILMLLSAGVILLMCGADIQRRRSRK